MTQSTFLEFARAYLPPVPARVLEVGCGRGELTTALRSAGYDALGIDPAAPPGEPFRRVLLEDLEPDEEPFDAVVAAHSLHHVRDLEHATRRIAELLRPGGVLVVDELGWDLADEATLDWLDGQRRALAAAGFGEAPTSSVALREEWDAEHVGVHRYEALRAALDARFEERAFAWTPYVHRLLRGATSDVLEQALIDAGAIRAIGFRYAGVARSRRRGAPAHPKRGSRHA